jgi:hypothetical protein
VILWKDEVAEKGNVLDNFLLKQFFFHFSKNKQFQNMVCWR